MKLFSVNPLQKTEILLMLEMKTGKQQKHLIKVDSVVSRSEQVFAIINGKLVKAEDIVVIPYNGRDYKFRIIAINPNTKRLNVKAIKD